MFKNIYLNYLNIIKFDVEYVKVNVGNRTREALNILFPYYIYHYT